MRLKCGTHFATSGKGVKFVFEEERAISRHGLVFEDVCVSQNQGTWHTHDDVNDEAREKFDTNNNTFLFHCCDCM